MTITVKHLPDAQRQVLLARYRSDTAARRARFLQGACAAALAVIVSAWIAEVDLAALFKHFGSFTGYFDRIARLDDGARVWTDPGEWFWGWKKWLPLLGETLLVAYVGTTTGAVFALALCFFSCANLNRNPWTRGLAKRFLEFCRTVPSIVLALIFVVAFGLGPLPGVLAIVIHSTGALGKLFAELAENIDMQPVEGLRSTGASWPQTIRFAVIPQVFPGFAGYGLLRFEINVREAAVMGMVGAGGIGQDLISAVRKFYYSDVSAILLIIIVTVFVIDGATDVLRRKLMMSESKP